jgi:ribosomal protein S19E (S16A)
VDSRRQAVERAVLVEALGGATRTELWLVARVASRFITTDEVDRVLNKLQAAGHLEKADDRWTTTATGRARLDRSSA